MESASQSALRIPAAGFSAGRTRLSTIGLSDPLPWLAAISLAGLAVRLPSFGSSLFGDEVGAYWIVTGHSLGRVISLMAGHAPSPELNPPLWFILAWVSQHLFGASPDGLKLVSLLAGLAIIPLTYLLGRWTIGVRAGLVAAALVALDPFLIFYSTEARPYALLVLMCLLSTLALWRALHSRSRWWWAGYAAFACGAAYTHFTSVFWLGAQFAWAFLAWPAQRRRLLIATAAAVIGFAPWLPALIHTAGSRGTHIYAELEPFTLHAARTDLGRWAIGTPYLELRKVPGYVGVALALSGVGVGLAGFAVRWGRQEIRLRSVWTRDLVLVLALAASAPVGVALYSAVHESIWASRQLIPSWPAFAVLVAALLTQPRRWVRGLAVLLVLAGLALGAVRLSQVSNQRPDYQAAGAYIGHSGYPTAPVVDLSAPTPGPPTEIEAALALTAPGQSHQVLRLNLPPLADVLKVPAYTRLRTPSGVAIAQQAIRLARDRVLFLVIPTALPVSSLEVTRARHLRTGTGWLANFAQFLGGLPAQFHVVAMKTFAGFAAVTVYEYRAE